MQRAGYEAMARERPVIASGTRVLREFFGDAALYASSGEELAAAVTALPGVAADLAANMRSAPRRDAARLRTQRRRHSPTDGARMNLVLVASGGGHLQQMRRLLPRFAVEADSVQWITYSTPQSRSLLENEEVTPAYFPTTRNVPNLFRNLKLARTFFASLEPGIAISTGAAIAVPFLSVARARGWSCHYVESATRVLGPSLSGRLLRQVPGVRMYHQSQAWRGRGWLYRGSVFDGFSVTDLHQQREIRRVVVSLGTHDLYPFGRLVERVAAVLPPDAEVIWQLGSTVFEPTQGTASPSYAVDVFERSLREADVVIADAGTGIALAALDAGKCPILVPRERRYHEHVDDHQVQLAAELQRRGLALAVAPNDLSRAHLRLVARLETESETPPPFRLEI